MMGDYGVNKKYIGSLLIFIVLTSIFKAEVSLLQSILFCIGLACVTDED